MTISTNTAEDRVSQELTDKINLLFSKISELKVTEDERRAFEAEKAKFQLRIEDYKKHKQALLEKVYNAKD